MEQGIREHGARRPVPPSFGRHNVRTARVVVDEGAEMTGVPIVPRAASGPVARPSHSAPSRAGVRVGLAWEAGGWYRLIAPGMSSASAEP